MLVLWPAYGQRISAEKIRAHVKFLSSDLLEGRRVGTRGGQLTTEYLATQFALAGAKPAAGSGSYFQPFDLVGVTTSNEAFLTAETSNGPLRFHWLDDFAGSPNWQVSRTEFDGEVVFLGYGVTAPELGWDDYAGVDVRGKVLLLFTGEPAPSSPNSSAAKALACHRKWNYQFAQALRMGATAVLLIPAGETAGHEWGLIRKRWGRESVQRKLSSGSSALAFAGWLTQEAGRRLLAASGHSVKELLDKARTPGFHGIPLGFRMWSHIPAKVRTIHTRNVAALVEGSDPDLRSQAVLFTAYWDQLGIGPAIQGDVIYNGGADGVIGCAMLLEVARGWAALRESPRRSALFLALGAEASGLLDSSYYGKHPIFPPEKTAAAIRFKALVPVGTLASIAVNGAESTLLWPLVQQAAARRGLTLESGPGPGHEDCPSSGRSFFARAGIPVFTISMGGRMAGKSLEWARQAHGKLAGGNHLGPSDGSSPGWDFAGPASIAEYGFLLGRMIADRDEIPTTK